MDIEASKFCPMMMFRIRTNAKRKYSDFYQNYFSATYFDFRTQIQDLGIKSEPKMSISIWKINPCGKLDHESELNRPFEPDEGPN